MRLVKKNNKIAFICPYPPDTAPGQRFRYEQYFDILKQAGFQYGIFAFLDQKTYNILYKRRFYLLKTFGILKGFIKRIIHLLKLIKYSYVFIFREATPIGPPIVEWIISKILRKKIIYDFDDAIWLPNTSESNKIITRIKCHWKVASICNWAYKVSCGNEYLYEYAKRFNPGVILNPTTIETVDHHNKLKDQSRVLGTEKIVIGWTGTHSTLTHLDIIFPVIRYLEAKYDFEFMVISDKEPDFHTKSLVFKKWIKSTEIQDLLKINIGLMPLKDTQWAKGKCGLKALQYMSLGIPAVVSPVGVNKQIVDDGVNGFTCNSESEWIDKIEILINDSKLRAEFGRLSREKVVKYYSVASNKENFLELFA